MAKRQAISKKTRFEVFKRDSFTCQYCGKSAPEIILHVDHIKPVKEGGTNRITNLVTSCIDCNLGKGARELSDSSVVEKQKAQLDKLQERKEQLDMIMEWHEALSNLDDDAVERFCDYWERLTDGEFSISESYKKKIKSTIKKYTLKSTLEAADIAAEAYFLYEDSKLTMESADNALDKLVGILKNKSRPEHEQKAYYIKAILRNRFQPRNDWVILQDVLRMYEVDGISMERMEAAAKSCRSISNFYQII